MAITLSLNKNDPWKGVKLEFRASEDVPDDQWIELSRRFVREIYSNMPRETGWFHQSGCLMFDEPSRYHMFEFWNFAQKKDVVREHSISIARTLGLELEILV